MVLEVGDGQTHCCLWLRFFSRVAEFLFHQSSAVETRDGPFGRVGGI